MATEDTLEAATLAIPVLVGSEEVDAYLTSVFPPGETSGNLTPEQEKIVHYLCQGALKTFAARSAIWKEKFPIGSKEYFRLHPDDASIYSYRN